MLLTIFAICAIVGVFLRAVGTLFSRLVPIVACGAKHNLALVAFTRALIGVAQTQRCTVQLGLNGVAQRDQVHARPVVEALVQRGDLRRPRRVLVLKNQVLDLRVIDLHHRAGAPAAIGLRGHVHHMWLQLQAIVQHQAIAFFLGGNLQLGQRMGQQLLQGQGLGLLRVAHGCLRCEMRRY